MNLREVTIGRSKSCDIYLDSRCKYASNLHGTIYYDGGQLMYRDSSTNGTLINNISVRKRAVPIHRGDIIMVAGQYPINWNQIDSFFSEPKPVQSPMAPPAVVSSVPSTTTVSELPNLSKWSWGAFYLSWIWGFFNGCWWLFLLDIVLTLLCFIPFVNFLFIPVALCSHIVYGVKGTEWAWENRQWNSVADFNRTQETWNQVGLVLFILSVVSNLCFLILAIAVGILD